MQVIKMNDFSAYMKQCTPIDLTRLSSTFQPRDHDVICGRGRKGFHHQGNVTFKKSIQDKFDEYINTSEKHKKTMLVSSMLDKCRESGTLFLKLDEKENRWYDIGDHKARQKVSHAFRDVSRRYQKEPGTRMSEPHVTTTFKAATANQNTTAPSMDKVAYRRKIEALARDLSRRYPKESGTRKSERNVTSDKRVQNDQNIVDLSTLRGQKRRKIEEKLAHDSLSEHVGVPIQPVQGSNVPTACRLPRVEEFEKLFQKVDKYEQVERKELTKNGSLLPEFHQRGYLKTRRI